MGHRKKNAGRDFLNVKIPAWMGDVGKLAAGADLKADRLRIVLHQFFLCWLMAAKSANRKKLHLYHDGYFPVSSYILRQVATDRYFEYVALMLRLGLIEKKSGQEGGANYSPGYHSQMYRFLLPDTAGAKIKFRDETVTDYRTIKSVLKKRDRYVLDDYEDSRRLKLLPIHETLKGFVLGTIIDMDIAADIEKKLNPSFATDAYAELDMLHLAAICSGDIGWHVVDSFGERYHNHIINIKKEFRPAIRFRGYEGEKLVSLDISCSQPFFLSQIASGKLFETLLQEFTPLSGLINELSKQPDYRHYRGLCEAGTFNRFLGAMRDIDPDIAKIEFFKAVVYSKKKVGPGDVAMRNEFRRFFPGVYKFIMAVKRLNENDLPALKNIIVETKGKYRVGNNSHKILPCLLQRAESRMIQNIAARMVSEGLGPFLVIHDAFLVLPDHVDRTIGVINEAFNALDIAPPTLKLKSD